MYVHARTLAGLNSQDGSRLQAIWHAVGKKGRQLKMLRGVNAGLSAAWELTQSLAAEEAAELCGEADSRQLEMLEGVDAVIGEPEFGGVQADAR